jgi:hypothetical protein
MRSDRRWVADIARRLEEIGGGVPRLVLTPKMAPQFIFPNGMILRFDLEPGQHTARQGPHLNLELPDARNRHIYLGGTRDRRRR